MASQFDDSDFVDREFHNAKSSSLGGPAHASMTMTGAAFSRPPSREELESRVSDTQNRLEELRRAQEELQRERAALEEARRRRIEFQAGREEMLQSLTRGVGLLEAAEFAARRDAEQLSKSLVGLRDALAQVQTLREDAWTQENWNAELTRALTTIENARLEWNSARLKWDVLNGGPSADDQKSGGPIGEFLAGKSFRELCELGFALTWPVAVIGFVAIILFTILILRH